MLTHLHLDHIPGLLFFAPLSPRGRDVIWGPPGQAALRERIARYISAPLSPVEVRELPCASPSATARRASGRSARRGSAPPGLPPRPDPRLPDRRRRRLVRLHPRPRARPRRRPRPARGGLDLRLRPRQGRLATAPRRPVQRRRVPVPRRLGPPATSHALSFARRTGAERTSSSTTIRATPTRSSTGSARRRASAGSSWAATRRRSSWPRSEASTSSQVRAPRGAGAATPAATA